MSVLPGGLRVCVESVPQYGRGLAALALTVAAGGDDDPAGRHGTAHLVEHLMFPRSGGGSAEPAGEGYAALVAGAGGVCNAETHRDHTVFHTTVPAESLPDALAWEARRLLGFAPTEDVIRTETDVIGEEIRGAGDAGRYWESALGALYPGSRDSFGTAAELAGITAGEVEAFFRAHYTAPRMVLSVVGDVDPARVMAVAGEVFAGVGVTRAAGELRATGEARAAEGPRAAGEPRAAAESCAAVESCAAEKSLAAREVRAAKEVGTASEIRTAVEPRTAERTPAAREIRTAPLPAARPGVAVGHPLPDPVADRPAYLAQAVLAQVLGRSRLPALARSARDGHRLTSATVTCGYHGQWLASAAPDLTLAVLGRAPGTEVGAAVGIWRSVLRAAAEGPLPEAEHRRAVNSLLVAWHRQADSLPARAVALGRDALLLPGSAGPDALPAELRRTTPAEVAAAARALLEGPVTVTELAPQAGTVPTARAGTEFARQAGTVPTARAGTEFTPQADTELAPQKGAVG
ncbi:M16 family metallopeptidase [Streptomyces pakalii]|uniref:Insulinase family protein n=1 Tax=Streptomyces pakalii TaxID=3036494 RepID=A0ABT7DI85_9ACTN|nr:insulinase family protein [Streptomyces pakalii]MDJ1644196.1 insulinase family protein [Streptomyces pakalii]